MNAAVVGGKAERGVSLEERRELASDNVKLAYYLAHRYKGIISLDEAISVALEALWIAALRYKPERQTPFSSYASVVIVNALRTAIRRVNQREIACLNEIIDPSDPGSSEEKIYTIQDPKSEDWETRVTLRLDCMRAMKETHGGSVVFLRDVCGFTFKQASSMIGLKHYLSPLRRNEVIQKLRRQLA